jgi:hypothetical protein
VPEFDVSAETISTRLDVTPEKSVAGRVTRNTRNAAAPPTSSTDSSEMSVPVPRFLTRKRKQPPPVEEIKPNNSSNITMEIPKMRNKRQYFLSSDEDGDEDDDEKGRPAEKKSVAKKKMKNNGTPPPLIINNVAIREKYEVIAAREIQAYTANLFEGNAGYCGIAQSGVTGAITISFLPGEPFECEECGELFASKHDITNHFHEKHKSFFRLANGVFKCAVCGLENSKKSHFLDHMVSFPS